MQVPYAPSGLRVGGARVPAAHAAGQILSAPRASLGAPPRAGEGARECHPHLNQADISVQPTRINRIVKGRAGISADTALRLGRFFRMSAQFWLNLQAHYNLEVARDRLEDRLRKEVSIHVA